MTGERVLVTGATGFIAKHCIAELLRSGYLVRGTVRSTGRRDEIVRAVNAAGADATEIELVEADLLDDAGWHAALTGCRYVLHVASPFPSREPRNADDLILPALEGTRRVLRAASDAGVDRVVQTSSIVAIMRSGRPDHEPRTEADWTDVTNSDVASYARSKTLAERAAWEFVDGLRERAKGAAAMELAVINPGLVLGPALDRDLSTSHGLIRLIGRGSYPALPKAAFPIVDVRDVARQHVVAMSNANAAGNRWLCAGETLSIKQVAEIISATLPDLKRRVPTIEIPSILIRIGSHFDRNLRSICADLDRANLVDNSKAIERLGMTFRPAEEAVRAAAQSLRDLRVI